MRKRPFLLGCALPLLILVQLCAVIYFFGDKIVDFWCSNDPIVASLDAGNDRSITIYAAACSEISVPMYFQVKENNNIIYRKNAFDFVDPSTFSNHNYSLIFAENRNLVGVMDAISNPPNLVIIYDFKTRIAYQIPKYDLYVRLRKDNPVLEIPSSYLPPTVEPISEFPGHVSGLSATGDGLVSSTDEICVDIQVGSLWEAGDYWEQDDIRRRIEIRIDGQIERISQEIASTDVISKLNGQGTEVGRYFSNITYCMKPSLNIGKHTLNVQTQTTSGIKRLYQWDFRNK